MQLRWNEYANAVPSHRPPFDGTSHITGHNLFVSAYHGFAQIGDEHVPEPKEWRPFPIVQIGFVSAVEVDNGNMLQIKYKVILEGESNANRYRLHLKIQLTSPGAGVRPGLMRTFVAEENCSVDADESISVLVKGYRTLWGLSLPEYRVYCRYSLIDTITGYRNNYAKASFLLSIDAPER